MPLPTGPYLIGTHAFFLREGDAFTLPAPGTVSRTAKPGEADPAWIDLGVIEESSDNLEESEIEIYRPAPGRLRLHDVLSTKDKLMLKFTTSELTALALEMLYRTLALTAASTQFNPLEGRAKKGWLKIQRYDQDDVQRVVMDLWVRLKIAGDMSFGGSEVVKPSFEALVLHSTLNSGTL